MPFITQGKTNWKFLLIVIVLAVIVAVFSWWGLTHIFFEPWDKKELTNRKVEQKVSLKTDKESYNQGENINIILDTAGKEVYLQKNVFFGKILFSKEYKVYKLEGNDWAELRINTYCGNVPMCSGDSNLVYPPCPAPVPPECKKVISPMTLTWDQKAYEYVPKTCGLNVGYYGEELKQVVTGEYKIKIIYYDNSSCQEGNQKYVETQFKIGDATANWKTYKNEEYNYEVKYPKDWMLDEKIKETVTLNSPENEKIMKDIIISYYSSVSEEPENKANKFGAVTIDELIQKDKLITPLGQITFAGEKAYEVTWAGFTATYSILVEKNNHLYKITFGNQDKSELTETEKQILYTFKFIESYTACGCGCCGGVEPTVKCLYHSKGDDIQKIIEDDKQAAQNSLCPQMGCSHPIKYIYCD